MPQAGQLGAGVLPDPHGFGTTVGALPGNTVINAQTVAADHTAAASPPIELCSPVSGK